MSDLESVRIVKCQNLKVLEFKSFRIGKCQNWKVFELERVRISRLLKYGANDVWVTILIQTMA